MTREEKNQEKQKEIVREENKEKRKKVAKITFKILFSLFILFTIIYLINDKIYTKKLVVRENRIINKNISESFSGTKIIQISDLHYGSTILIKDVKRLVDLINSRKPDLVIFTGDLINKDYKLNSDDKEKLIKELNNIKTPIGKYAVLGNEDKEDYTVILKQAGFDILNNDYDLVYNNNQEPIIIIGISSLLNKNYDLDKAFNYYNDSKNKQDIYSIAIFHEPDLTDKILEKHKVDLLLAGHSHNNYIGIKGIQDIFKTKGSEKYYKEHYIINDSELYISGGIGTNGLGIRYILPSINLFRLSNK